MPELAKRPLVPLEGLAARLLAVPGSRRRLEAISRSDKRTRRLEENRGPGSSSVRAGLLFATGAICCMVGRERPRIYRPTSRSAARARD